MPAKPWGWALLHREEPARGIWAEWERFYAKLNSLRLSWLNDECKKLKRNSLPEPQDVYVHLHWFCFTCKGHICQNVLTDNLLKLIYEDLLLKMVQLILKMQKCVSDSLSPPQKFLELLQVLLQHGELINVLQHVSIQRLQNKTTYLY